MTPTGFNGPKFAKEASYHKTPPKRVRVNGKPPTKARPVIVETAYHSPVAGTIVDAVAADPVAPSSKKPLIIGVGAAIACFLAAVTITGAGSLFYLFSRGGNLTSHQQFQVECKKEIGALDITIKPIGEVDRFSSYKVILTNPKGEEKPIRNVNRNDFIAGNRYNFVYEDTAYRFLHTPGTYTITVRDSHTWEDVASTSIAVGEPSVLEGGKRGENPGPWIKMDPKHGW